MFFEADSLERWRQDIGETERRVDTRWRKEVLVHSSTERTKPPRKKHAVCRLCTCPLSVEEKRTEARGMIHKVPLEGHISSNTHTCLHVEECNEKRRKIHKYTGQHLPAERKQLNG